MALYFCALVSVALLLFIVSGLSENATSYTVYDEYSWSIRSVHLAAPEKQAMYDDFMLKCAKAAGNFKDAQEFCIDNDYQRLRRNILQPPSVRNYTELGYEKVRAPHELMHLLENFWEANHRQAVLEQKNVDAYQNTWDAPSYIIHVQNESLTGGGPALLSRVWDESRHILQEWTGQRLVPCSQYGIRIYKNNSILTPHVDKLPRVSSAIINVAQDVDKPWPLEIYGHDGIARNVTMEPGDMLLYESHSVIHGRPFPMQGRYFGNLFVHFEPIRPLSKRKKENKQILDEDEDEDSVSPPYVLPNSPWEKIWLQDNPNGWSLHVADAHFAAHSGNLEALQEVERMNPAALHHADDNGFFPIHECVRAGHTHALEFLLDQGVDVNARTSHGLSPLWLAQSLHGSKHPVTALLKKSGAKAIGPDWDQEL